MAESTVSDRWSKHLEFYTHTVTFLVCIATAFLLLPSNIFVNQVEDHLFRIPREPLEAESTVFRNMFLLPQCDSETVEGLSDMYPVALPQGVSKKEFESLLRALMYRQHGKNKGPCLDQDQWISVLKLSTMWKFDELRKVAIQRLDQPFQPLNPVEKFVLASKYGIKQWILPALLVLAQRSEPISVEEGHRIGFDNALKLAAVREEFKRTRLVNLIHRKYTLKLRDEISIEGPKDKEKEARICSTMIHKAFHM
ncbi:hypothetical protein EDC04DRAFT_2566843 [Pisolithus marmoratus]|nr:hypothetical protein EDC04DRAFT_2566843 [Pisolithus marmoratus]